MRNSWGGRTARKYKNQPIKYDGFTFSSEVEYQRYLILAERQRQGEIADLRVHPGFWLDVYDQHIFDRPFRPDFSYRLVRCSNDLCLLDAEEYRRADPRQPEPSIARLVRIWCPQCCVVEDVKGFMDATDPATRIFKIQCRLMEALYGIHIQVVQTVLTKRRQEARKKNQKEKRRLQRLTLRELKA